MGLTLSQIHRDYDGPGFARTVIPRLKVEYQPTRAHFIGVVSQYQAQRTDWLVSYEPTPGTVAFFGYGDTRDTLGSASFADLKQRSDGSSCEGGVSAAEVRYRPQYWLLLGEDERDQRPDMRCGD